MSQQRLAELLQVSVRTVSRWECGDVEPDAATRKRIDRLSKIVEERLKVNPVIEEVIRWLTTPRSIECSPVDLISTANQSDRGLRHLYDQAK